MRHALALSFLFIAGCAGDRSGSALTEAELESVKAVIQSYADAWIAMDSAAVLGLFTEDATISPSGLHPKQGKKALREFWFPDDGSSTDVHAYDIEVLGVGGSGDMAYTYERGSLSFTYSRGETSISRDSQSYGTTLYRRTGSGAWKIFHRTWSDLRVN